MNNITYAVNVDVNNPVTSYNVYVASVRDSNIRNLEIMLYENGNVITLSANATATAALVTDGVLVDDSVACTISENKITVPLTDLQRHGTLDVQVTVSDDSKVLSIPFPIQIKVTPNIAETAQIDDNSMGSYAEVVQEIATARGQHETLNDRLNSIEELPEECIAELANKADKTDVYTKTETAEILKERAPSVKDYGAKGDGKKDDTDAIYKAIVRNDVVYFPPGTYRTAGIIITNPEMETGGSATHAKTLFGAGRKSIIKPITVEGYFCRNCGCVYRDNPLPETCNAADGCGKPSSFFTAFDIIVDKDEKYGNAALKIGRLGDDKKTDIVEECTISDLTIDARERAAGKDDSGNLVTEKRFRRGLYLYGTNRTTIHNVAVYFAGSNGFEIADGARDCHFTNIKVKNCKNIGIKYYGFGNSFANVETSQNEGDGINITTGGCQFANVKAWANRRAGLRIDGAKYCMIANVNSQQNRGSGLVIEGNAAYNVVTGFESVGNNFTLKNTSTPWEPNLTFEGGSGLVVGGHDNNVQGSDVRAKWDTNWKAVEKSALYIPEGAHDNRVDLVCAEGDTPLSTIYADQNFADIGFDRSVLYAKHNSFNNVHISSGTQLDVFEFDNNLKPLGFDESKTTLSTLDGFNEKAVVTRINNSIKITGNNENPNAVNEITPRALADSCADGNNVTGYFISGGNTYGFPVQLFYEIPIAQIVVNRLLQITLEGTLKAAGGWIAVPILRLSDGNTERFINNKFADTALRGIENTGSRIRRTFSYLLSSDKLGETQWTACHLVIAMLKTQSNRDTAPQSVEFYPGGISCTSNNVIFAGNEFDEAGYFANETTCKPITLKSGYIATKNVNKIDINNRIPNTSFASAAVKADVGDRFVVDVIGGNTAAAWAFLDSDKHILTSSSGLEVNDTITAPVNTKYLVINNKKIEGSVYKIGSRVSTVINQSADNFAVPTAKAVYEAIQAALGGGTS